MNEYFRCPKCDELLEETDDELLYCKTEDCEILDGIIKDEDGMFGYGKEAVFINMDYHADFMGEVLERKFHAERVEEEAKKEYWKWKQRYYRTIDYVWKKKISEFIDRLKQWFVDQIDRWF